MQCSFILSESKMAIKIIKTKPKSKCSSKIWCTIYHIQSRSMNTIIAWEMCAYGLKNFETYQNNDKNR